MEQTFFRENGHNYFCRKLNQNQMEPSDFRIEMVRRNAPASFLPFSLMWEDGTVYCRYEITGLQTVKDYLTFGKIDAGFTERMIRAIAEVLEQTDRFMLDREMVSFDLGLIYMDPLTGTFQFVFRPDCSEDSQKMLQEMAKTLISFTEDQDYEVNAVLFRFYKEILSRNPEPEELRKCLNKYEPTPALEDRKTQKERNKAYRSFADEEQIRPDQSAHDDEETVTISWEESEDTAFGDRERSETRKRNGILGFFHRKKTGKQDSGREDPAWEDPWTGEERFKEAEILEENDFSKEISLLHAASSRKNSSTWNDHRSLNENRIPKESEKTELLYTEEDSDTVFLRIMDTGEKIPVCETPFLIGKQKENHFRPEGSGISRYHLKIEMENGAYYITDLNSTNGTWIEQKPMAPNERCLLENRSVIEIPGMKLQFFCGIV